MATPKRIKYVCDFETTTDPNDCHVWSWGAMEIGNPLNYVTGIDIESFYEFMQEGSNKDIYIHNLSFDNEFILPKLFEEGFSTDNLKTGERRKVKPKTFNLIKTIQNQLYSMDVTFGYRKGKKIHVNIIDSLKIIPISVKQIPDNFNFEFKKGDIDYNKPRPKGYQPTAEEWDYLYYDIYIVAEALQFFLSAGLKGNTMASMAMNEFKEILKDEGIDFRKIFPEVDLEMDDFFRKGYRGGFTWVHPDRQNKKLDEGKVFDVNSLYPYIMTVKDFPYGTPIPLTNIDTEIIDRKHNGNNTKNTNEYKFDQTHPLYYVHVKMSFELKPDHIPCIQRKKAHLHSKTNEYLTTSDGEPIDLYLTNIDLELIERQYNIEYFETIKGYKFKRLNGIFQSYIEKWSKVKKEKKIIVDGKLYEGEGVKYLSKLMLNSLYGKFASAVIKTKMIATQNEDIITQYEKPEEEDLDTPIYTPMAMFITAYARSYTISTAQACYDRFIYADTDSIHLLGLETPEAIKDIIHPKDLGKWKHEYDFKKAKYIRAKTYIDDAYIYKTIDEKGDIVEKECSKEESNSNKLVVKCAGMPDKIKEKVTFENFEVGFTSHGKLIPKRVRHGVVLVDTEFTIK